VVSGFVVDAKRRLEMWRDCDAGCLLCSG
jgi:hypothetical protein